MNRSAAESEAPLSLLVIDMKIVAPVSGASLDVAQLICVCVFVSSVSLHVARIWNEIGVGPVITDAKAFSDAARIMSVSRKLSRHTSRTRVWGDTRGRHKGESQEQTDGVTKLPW